MAVQPVAINKKRRRKKDPYCGGHTKRHYISHIAVFFSNAAITFAQNDIFVAAGFLERCYISVTATKTGLLRWFYVHRCRTLQKTLPIAAGQKGATIGNI